MRRKVGDRVGALQSADDEEVRFFGYGVYQGYEPCPILDDMENPKILLDDGRIVWGCECWWASEDRIKEAIGDRRVVNV